MAKFLLILVLACVIWRHFTGRWPWQAKALTKPTGKENSGSASEIAQARILLGVQPDAGRRDILEAHRKRLTAVHPDRGGSNEQVHEANAARDALLAQLSSES